MASPNEGRRLRGITLVELFMVMAITGTMVLFIAPAIVAARSSAAKASCMNNLRLLGLALHNYGSAWGVLPPSCIRGEGHGNGHSVFTALLPFIDLPPIYNTYNFDLENSHDANSTAFQVKISAFLCPENPNDRNTTREELADLKMEGDLHFGKTHYGANWGGGREPWGADFVKQRGKYLGVMMTVLDDDGKVKDFDGNPRARVVQFKDIGDGTAQTVAFAEKRDSFGWAVGGWGGSEFDAFTNPIAPDDDRLGRKVYTGSYHPKLINAVFADGSVRQLMSEMDIQLWYALLTRNSGEALAENPPGMSAPIDVQSQVLLEKDAGRNQTAKDAEQLFQAIKAAAVAPSKLEGGTGIFVMDLKSGEVVLAASEPVPGLNSCGSPVWSQDGKSILFDAMPLDEIAKTRIESIVLKDGRILLKDLGPGNCPFPSPVDQRVMFLLNPGQVPDGEMGVWLMQGDGSDRTKLGGYGRPRWAPNGDQFLIVDFAKPPKVILIDQRVSHWNGRLDLGEPIVSVPSWTNQGMIVAALSRAADGKNADHIGLIETKGATPPKVTKLLWNRGDGADVDPIDPVYDPVADRCLFIGGSPEGMAIYAASGDDQRKAKKLENLPPDRLLRGLALSPDGRFLLFASSRGEPPRN